MSSSQYKLEKKIKIFPIEINLNNNADREKFQDEVNEFIQYYGSNKIHSVSIGNNAVLVVYIE